MMSPSRTVVVDIGNTSTSVGLYQAGRIRRVARLDSDDATVPSIDRMLRRLCGRSGAHAAMVASVVPRLNARWKRALRAYVGRQVAFVHHGLNLGVRVSYPQPRTIGADRLANASAGVLTYGAPLIVADFGTAVTFDVITARDGYVGGIIGPGLPLMFRYMAEKTAQLPLLRPRARPRGRIGRSTRHAMELGAIWGYRGLVREILKELRREPALRNARLCATGGYAAWVVRGMGAAMALDPTLTLRGIGRIHELNTPTTAHP